MKKIYLMYPQVIGKIAPQIYGHFTEHIGGGNSLARRLLRRGL